MKSAHLQNIERRRQRLLQALLPDEAESGGPLREFEDPFGRLKQVIKRVGGIAEDSVANAVEDLVRMLETDVPDMLAAIKALASREPKRCRYCGESWDALLVPASVKDPEHPGQFQCRDVDGCESRLMRAGETVVGAEAVAAAGRHEDGLAWPADDSQEIR